MKYIYTKTHADIERESKRKKKTLKRKVLVICRQLRYPT